MDDCESIYSMDETRNEQQQLQEEKTSQEKTAVIFARRFA